MIIFLKDRAANVEPGYQEIDCFINGGNSIGCRKEGEEIYIPFSFIHKYFEVGDMFHEIKDPFLNEYIKSYEIFTPNRQFSTGLQFHPHKMNNGGFFCFLVF